MSSAVICHLCDTDGPVRELSKDARVAARDAGWSRCYTGSEEAWRCPPCRATRRPGARPRVHALRESPLDPVPAGQIVAVTTLSPYRGFEMVRVDTDPPPPGARYWYLVAGVPFTMARRARAHVDHLLDEPRVR